jgi:hypothetical protein
MLRIHAPSGRLLLSPQPEFSPTIDDVLSECSKRLTQEELTDMSVFFLQAFRYSLIEDTIYSEWLSLDAEHKLQFALCLCRDGAMLSVSESDLPIFDFIDPKDERLLILGIVDNPSEYFIHPARTIF